MNRNARRFSRLLALALVAMSLGACHFCGRGWGPGGGWGWGHGNYYHSGGHGGHGGHCR